MGLMSGLMCYREWTRDLGVGSREVFIAMDRDETVMCSLFFVDGGMSTTSVYIRYVLGKACILYHIASLQGLTLTPSPHDHPPLLVRPL